MSEREERRLIRELADALDKLTCDNAGTTQRALVSKARAHLARPDRVAEVIEAARLHFKHPTRNHALLQDALDALDAAEREAGR